MRTQRWLSVLLVIILALGWTPQALAGTSEQFSREGSELTEITIVFDDAGQDGDTNITFPAVEVLEARMDISPEANDGAYAEGLWLDVRNNSNYEWGFDGQGYGAFGQQYRFANGRTAWTMNLNEGDGTDTAEVLLPAEATVTSATLSISGLPEIESDQLDHQALLTAYTNIGSTSAIPAVVVDYNSTVHLVWVDSGDLLENGSNEFDVFYRNWDGSQWSPIQQLSGNLTGLTTPVPTIATAGDYVYVAWPNYPFDIEWVVSSDLGLSWSQPTNLDSPDSWLVYSPSLAAFGTEVHLAWQDAGDHDGDDEADYDILYTMSNDQGGNWSAPQVVSDGTSDEASILPALALAGTDLYVVWADNGSYDGDGTDDFDILQRTTTDDGDTWSNIRVISTSAGEADQPAVAADTSDEVNVVWQEFSNLNSEYRIHYRHSGNGGVTWDSEQTLTSGPDDYLPGLPDVTFVGSQVYVAWYQVDNETQEQHAKLRISSNGGTTFGGAQIIDEEGYSRFRADVNLALAPDGSLWATWSDRQQKQLPGGTWASTEQDIWLRRSDAGGSSWDEALVASEQYYEADSGNMQMAVDPQGNYYAVYWDAGDYSGNGNDQHTDDGDLFFIRSTNGGANWSDPFVITQRDNDGRNFISYLYPPDIAAGADGSVYIVWHERGLNGTQDANLTFRRSTDYGDTWEPVEVLYNDPVQNYYPRIAAAGHSVHILWEYDDSQLYHIFYMRSEDQGESWSDREELDGRVSDFLSLQARDDLVVAGWESSDSLYYTLSDDGGLEWDEVIRYQAQGAVDQPMLALDDTYLYLVYLDDQDDDGYEDVIMSISNDTGQTWEEPFIVGPSDGYDRWYPSVDARDGLVAVGFFAYNDEAAHYDQYYTLSRDNGRSWYTVRILSDKATQLNVPTTAACPAAISVDEQVVVAWRDSQPLKNSTHAEIWSRSSDWQNYPEDPNLKVGAGSTPDWQFAGELNRDNSPEVWSGSALVDALNDALGDADTFKDDYGVEMARVLIDGSANDGGRLLLEDMVIDYDVTLTVENSALLNSFYRASNNSAGKGHENTAPIFSVVSGSAGGVSIFNLEIVTAHADLELSSIIVEDEGSLKEGQPVDLSVEVTNDGNGQDPAEVEVIFWWSEDGSGEPGLGYNIDDIFMEVPADGSPVTFEATWDEPEEGNVYLHARIVDSTPADESGNANDEQKQIDVAPATVIIGVANVEFSEEVVETVELEVTLTLENTGEKEGNLDLQVYLDSSSGTQIYDTTGLKVGAGNTLKLDFDWTVEPADTLVIEWQESGGPTESYDYTDMEVLKLPDLEMLELTWDPEVVVDNTQVTFEVIWRNNGDIGVSANVQLYLDKSGERDLVDMTGREDFLAGQSRTFTMTYTFKSLGGKFDPLTGDYSLETMVHTLDPLDSKYSGLWDQGTLTFTDDSNVLSVAAPPDIDVMEVNLPSSVKENSQIEVQVELRNNGESMASFTLQLFVFLEGKASSTPMLSDQFEIDGGVIDTFTLTYDVPEDQVGKYVFRAVATDIQPAETGANPEADNEASVTVDIAGTIETTGDDDTGFPVALLGGAIAIMLIGIGAVGFFLMRSSPSDEAADTAPASVPDLAPGTEAGAMAGAAGVAGAATTTTPTPPPAPATAPPAQASQPPPTPPAGAVNITCPKCATKITVSDTSRPLTVPCTSCNAQLRLEQ